MTSIADRFKARSRKRISVLNGELEFEIRVVTMGEVTVLAGSPPAVIAGLMMGNTISEDDRNDPHTVLETATYSEKLTKAVVICGVTAAFSNGEIVTLEIVDKPAIELESHQIMPIDLGDDLNRVYNAIIELSGLPLAKQAEKRFPSEVAGNPRRNGRKVQLPPK
jgi:hypothetical protein